MNNAQSRLKSRSKPVNEWESYIREGTTLGFSVLIIIVVIDIIIFVKKFSTSLHACTRLVNSDY